MCLDECVSLLVGTDKYHIQVSDPADSVFRSWRHKQKYDWLGCTLFNWVSWVELCRYKHPFTAARWLFFTATLCWTPTLARTASDALWTRYFWGRSNMCRPRLYSGRFWFTTANVSNSITPTSLSFSFLINSSHCGRISAMAGLWWLAITCTTVYTLQQSKTWRYSVLRERLLPFDR